MIKGDGIYYYDRCLKQWCDTENNLNIHSFGKKEDFLLTSELINDLRNARHNKKFLIIKNVMYAGIDSPILYIQIDDDLKFVDKKIIYRKHRSRVCEARTCIPIDSVINKSLLKKIKTDFPSVVDFIDRMQRERAHWISTQKDIEKIENENRARAQRCFDELFEDQQMYYMIEGDCKYL